MIKDIDGLIKEVSKQIKDFTDIAVIGMSGGADSTLVAILCKEALGKENVVGVHMPYSQTDLDKFNSNSAKIAAKLKIRNEWFDISKPVDDLTHILTTNSFSGPQLSLINAGNIRSRMRMICLYATASIEEYAFKKRARVIGTDNLNENYIGFFTKYGDGGVDINPIASLYKSEVYQLLDYFRDNKVIDEEMIDRIPSAGLWEGQTDEGELGHSYAEMEQSIRRCIAGKAIDHIVDEFVENRHEKNEHKNNMPPVIDLSKFKD